MVLEGERGRDGRAPGHRRHEPARGDDRARSAATSRSRSARTWSTARTRPSRPSARRRSSSPSSGRSAGRAARPGLALAPAPRDPRAARGRASRCAPPDVDEEDAGEPGRVASRERPAQGAAPPGVRRRGGARRRHARGARRSRSGASRPTPRPRARRCAACRAATHHVVSGLALRARRRGAGRDGRHRGHLPHAGRGARSTGTWPPASGASGPAATRSRGAARALVERDRRRLPQRRRAARGDAAGPLARACSSWPR